MKRLGKRLLRSTISVHLWSDDAGLISSDRTRGRRTFWIPLLLRYLMLWDDTLLLRYTIITYVPTYVSIQPWSVSLFCVSTRRWKFTVMLRTPQEVQCITNLSTVHVSLGRFRSRVYEQIFLEKKRGDMPDRTEKETHFKRLKQWRNWHGQNRNAILNSMLWRRKWDDVIDYYLRDVFECHTLFGSPR